MEVGIRAGARWLHGPAPEMDRSSRVCPMLSCFVVFTVQQTIHWRRDSKFLSQGYVKNNSLCSSLTVETQSQVRGATTEVDM